MLKRLINKIFELFKNNKAYFIKFFVAFTISKFALVFVPIVLSNQVDSNQYAIFEYALSWGLILSVLFRFGFEYSFSNLNLVKKDNSFNSVVYFHGLALGLLVFILLLLLSLEIISEKAAISIGFGLILAIQGLLSNTYFTFGQPARGSLNQNGLLNVIGLVCIVLLFNKQLDFNRLLLLFLLIYFIYLEYSTFLYYNKSPKTSIIKGYKYIFDYGLRSLVFVLVYMWIFHSWKIFTEVFLGIVMVGIFSIYYRVTSVVIVFEKMLEQLFFKQIYQKPLKVIDRYFSFFLTLILIFVLAFSLIFKTFFVEYVSIIKTSINLFPSLLWVFSVSMVFWSSITLSQKVLLREKISFKIIIFYIIISIFSILTLYILYFLEKLHIELLVFLFSVVLYIISEVNFYEIKKVMGYNFRNSRIITFISLFILLIFYFV